MLRRPEKSSGGNVGKKSQYAIRPKAIDDLIRCLTCCSVARVVEGGLKVWYGNLRRRAGGGSVLSRSRLCHQSVVLLLTKRDAQSIIPSSSLGGLVEVICHRTELPDFRSSKPRTISVIERLSHTIIPNQVRRYQSLNSPSANPLLGHLLRFQILSYRSSDTMATSLISHKEGQLSFPRNSQSLPGT